MIDLALNILLLEVKTKLVNVPRVHRLCMIDNGLRYRVLSKVVSKLKFISLKNSASMNRLHRVIRGYSKIEDRIKEENCLKVMCA